MKYTAFLVGGLILFSLLKVPCTAAPAIQLYVAPQGSDSNTGEKEQPFQTLERARNAIREIKRKSALPGGGVVIHIQKGTYFLKSPLELGAEDSGDSNAPISYQGESKDNTILTGGVQIGGFTQTTSEDTLQKLPSLARGKVYECNLKAIGLSNYGNLSRRGFGLPLKEAQMELFFQNRPMTLARYPNGKGYALTGDLPEGHAYLKFSYKDDRISEWKNESDPWVFGYFFHDWADTYVPISKIDPETSTLSLQPPAVQFGIKKDHRFYGLNLLCELDEPGEYYIDRKGGILYFIPPEPLKNGHASVSITSTLIKMKGASHISFQNLTLEETRATAAVVENASNVFFKNCIVRNTGNRGIQITASSQSGVSDSDIYETGDGGIYLSGGDRKTLAPAKLFADNNHIHHFSRWCRTYRPAIQISGVGNRASHNLIHDAPHSGIHLAGNDHLIEYNEIHHVTLDTGDVGAFYTGRDWTARGTVIRHNYFHDISGPGEYGAMGVYLDDQASGFTVYGNVFQNVTKAAFIGGGCDNIVENNIFVDCKPSIHIDARGILWQKEMTDDRNDTLHKNLASVPYREEPWKSRYPELVNILNDDVGTPKRNRVEHNIFVGEKWNDIDEKTSKYQTVKNNLYGKDPKFDEISKFTLKPDSPAWEIGFKPIPFEKIGLQKNSP